MESHRTQPSLSLHRDPFYDTVPPSTPGLSTPPSLKTAVRTFYPSVPFTRPFSLRQGQLYAAVQSLHSHRGPCIRLSLLAFALAVSSPLHPSFSTCHFALGRKI